MWFCIEGKISCSFNGERNFQLFIRFLNDFQVFDFLIIQIQAVHCGKITSFDYQRVFFRKYGVSVQLFRDASYIQRWLFAFCSGKTDSCNCTYYHNCCRHTNDYFFISETGFRYCSYNSTGTKKLSSELFHGAVSVLAFYGKSFQKNRFLFLWHGYPKLWRFFEGIFLHTLDGFLRNLACDAEIDGCRHRIDIGPYALVSVCMILLNRCISLLCNNHVTEACVCLNFCTTKIQKLQGTVSENHDIIRTDISVENSMLMEILKRWHNRIQFGSHFIDVQFSALCFYIFLKVDSIQIFQYHVNGIILIEEIIHFYNSGKIIQMCDNLCFSFELFTIQTVVLLLRVSRTGADRDGSRGTVISVHISLYKKFLDCHNTFQHHVHGDISNSKSTFSQNFSYKISSIQHCIRCQNIWRHHIGTLIKMAVRAYILLRFFLFHTVNT